MEQQHRQWVAGSVLAVLAVLAAGWFLLVSPRHAEAAEERLRAQEQEQANAMLRTDLTVLAEQKRNLPQREAVIRGAAVKIPLSPLMPALIRGLSAAAQQSEVEFVSLTPGAPAAVPGAVPRVVSPVVPAPVVPVPGGPLPGAPTPGAPLPGAPAVPTPVVPAPGAPVPGAPAVPTPAVPMPAVPMPAVPAPEAPAPAATVAPVLPGAGAVLVAVPIVIEVVGAYVDLERYVAALETLPRAVRVTGLNIKPGQEAAAAAAAAGADTGRTRLRASITGSVFMVTTSPVSAVPGAPVPVPGTPTAVPSAPSAVPGAPTAVPGAPGPAPNAPAVVPSAGTPPPAVDVPSTPPIPTS